MIYRQKGYNIDVTNHLIEVHRCALWIIFYGQKFVYWRNHSKGCFLQGLLKIAIQRAAFLWSTLSGTQILGFTHVNVTSKQFSVCEYRCFLGSW